MSVVAITRGCRQMTANVHFVPPVIVALWRPHAVVRDDPASLTAGSVDACDAASTRPWSTAWLHRRRLCRQLSVVIDS